MGESFLGIPNRFRNIDNLLEKTYNPNHMLSAHMGYVLSTEYLNRAGGTTYSMKGPLYSQDIYPIIAPTVDATGQEKGYDIGTPSLKFRNIYANHLIGNASSASRLDHRMKLSVTGDMTGSVEFNCSESVLDLNLTKNHNHDDQYLKLTGGRLTGSIQFYGTDIGLKNSYGYPVFAVNSNNTYIGQGPYTRSTGSLSLYSHEELNVYSKSKINLRVMKSDGTTVAKTLAISDSGLTYDGKTIYHTGNANFIPVSASCNKNWNWVGQAGQPSWVWGGNDGTNMYVYNPSNFKVSYANSSGSCSGEAYKTRRLISIISPTAEKGVCSGVNGVYHQYSVIITENGYLRPASVHEWYDTAAYNGASYNSDGYMDLGVASYRWKQVFSKKGTISTSDKNMKEYIMNLSDKHLQFLMLLEPSSYMFKDPSSDRIHIGFIAQQVEEAMNIVGLTDLDFAGFCKDIRVTTTVDSDGNEVEKPVYDNEGNPEYIYSLRYEEFIALNTHAIQTCFKEIQQLKINMTEEMTDLKNLIAQKI